MDPELFSLLYYALYLENVRSFSLCMVMCKDIELLPSPIDDYINAISYFLGRSFISIPETVSSFLLGIKAHPNPACFPRAMVTRLASANHLLSGAKICLCLPFSISLATKALLNDFHLKWHSKLYYCSR